MSNNLFEMIIIPNEEKVLLNESNKKQFVKDCWLYKEELNFEKLSSKFFEVIFDQDERYIKLFNKKTNVFDKGDICDLIKKNLKSKTFIFDDYLFSTFVKKFSEIKFKK